jgi:hypothetical protein
MSSGTDVLRLLSKLQVQTSFQEDGQAALSFGSVSPRVLALINPQEKEWRLHSKETALKRPEMPFDVLGVWAEYNPLELAINIPPVVIDAQFEKSAPCLTPPCLRKTPYQLNH